MKTVEMKIVIKQKERSKSSFKERAVIEMKQALKEIGKGVFLF